MTNEEEKLAFMGALKFRERVLNTLQDRLQWLNSRVPTMLSWDKSEIRSKREEVIGAIEEIKRISE